MKNLLKRILFGLSVVMLITILSGCFYIGNSADPKKTDSDLTPKDETIPKPMN